ncbi:unnamed protein product [Chilo suppressalis]|uniref:Uncharacterized protein n=1 Tax=Chilo suppressalis TaxID=168631 RepID=A0ABN8AY64_CHISP|nr:unnamed protein product [Chilo suppressalis]
MYGLISGVCCDRCEDGGGGAATGTGGRAASLRLANGRVAAQSAEQLPHSPADCASVRISIDNTNTCCTDSLSRLDLNGRVAEELPHALTDCASVRISIDNTNTCCTDSLVTALDDETLLLGWTRTGGWLSSCRTLSPTAPRCTPPSTTPTPAAPTRSLPRSTTRRCCSSRLDSNGRVAEQLPHALTDCASVHISIDNTNTCCTDSLVTVLDDEMLLLDKSLVNEQGVQ